MLYFLSRTHRIDREVVTITINRSRSAKAIVQGYGEYRALYGEVLFLPRKNMVLVSASISGFPKDRSMFHGFHIHKGESCTGIGLADTKGHYDPKQQTHPFHAGDLPPLLSYGSSAYLSFRTNRFTVRELIGRTVVIHSGTDDFRTQPSGDSGRKIACGVIRRV